MRKTLYRQHADLKEEFRQGCEAFLHRVETDAAATELAEAVAWMQADAAALTKWELQHPSV